MEQADSAATEAHPPLPSAPSADEAMEQEVLEECEPQAATQGTACAAPSDVSEPIMQALAGGVVVELMVSSCCYSSLLLAA